MAHTQTNTIPNFESNSPVRETVKVLMIRNTIDSINLSRFAIDQFIKGIQSIEPGQQVPSDMPILLGKLYSASLDADKYNQNMIGINVSRLEMQFLREMLEARMLHCEKERDEENKVNSSLNSNLRNSAINIKFNPDTYIQQKLLLIDIREWQLGEVIEVIQDTTVDEAISKIAATDGHNLSKVREGFDHPDAKYSGKDY